MQAPATARLSAMGGINVSLADEDLGLQQFNPSLTGDTLQGWALAGFQWWLAGIHQTSLYYAHNFRTVGVLTFGVQRMGYGSITSYDDTGAEIGRYDAAETVLTAGRSHQIGHFRIGASVKFAFSNLAGFRANALLFDVGGVFIHPRQRLMIGLSIRNVGFVVSDYSSANRTTLPLDVQCGVTFKPEHMPVRFSCTAYRLADPDAFYGPASGTAELSVFDRVFRHFNFAGEVLVHRHVDVIMAYNYGIRQELKVADRPGGSGLSLGVSLHMKAFDFTMSRSTYATGISGYTFSLSQDINKLLKRKSYG